MYLLKSECLTVNFRKSKCPMEYFQAAYFSLCHFNMLIYSNIQLTVLMSHVGAKKDQAVMGWTAS